jgi:class 3 adenylate cyclase/tetratricopeptide (TPR) repeat protein
MTSTTTVTVLFTDVVGNTALRQRLGDAAAELVLRDHSKVIRDQIGPTGGREVKTIGDSFMVAFDSARKAVDCAIAIQRALADRNRGSPDEQVQVRIGINAGEATEEHGDLFGTAVNAAKYIEGKAQPDQILVPETVKALIGPVKDLAFVDRGRFRLKGFPERWRLYEVVWREGAPAAPAYLERTPFVGRETERAELRRLLEGALRGQGALAMIGGEPGVGKTRLAEELAAEARERGALALIGHCYEMEGAPPYIPFVEVIESAVRAIPPDGLREALGDAAPEVAKLLPELRHLVPDIPPPLELPPEQERHFLFNNLRAFLARAAAARPLLLVLDDLQWADDATLLLLEHIAQGLHEMPVLILGTYRDMELDVARPLARTLEDLVRQRLAHDLALRRLPEAGVAAILRGLSGREPPPSLVQVIFGETEGNPFFVEEVFKHLAEEGRLFDPSGKDWRADLRVGELDVPRGVRLVIGRRLERVCEDCRRVLTAAAVIGRAFTFELLQALVDPSTGSGQAIDEESLLDAVDEAERAHLITSGEGREARFSFAHELIRQTLLSGMSLPRRQRMHLRVAEALEKTYSGNVEEHASDLAHHLYQAGAATDPEKTVRYLALAGDQAVAASAFEDAVRLFGEALSLQEADDPRGRAALLFKKGLAVRSLGRWDTDLDDWREALSIYERLGASEEVGRLCYEIAMHMGWAARVDDMREIVSRGLAALGDTVSAERCLLLAVAGLQATWGPPETADYAVAEEMFARALAMARELGDELLEGPILRNKAVHDHAWCRWRQVLEDARGAELLRAAGNLWDAVDLMSFVAIGLIGLGRLAEAEDVFEEVEREGERLGHASVVWQARLCRPFLIAWRTGDLDSAEQLARDATDFGERHAIGWNFMSQAELGRVLFARGRWDEARAECARAAELEGASVVSDGYVSGLILQIAAHEGRREEFHRLLGRYQSRLSLIQGPITLGLAIVLTGAIEGLAVLGEREAAAKLYRPAKGVVDAGIVLLGGNFGVREATAGIAAACGEQWDRAEEHFETALRQAHELPNVLAQPETRRWYAWMLLDRERPGDREKARELLTEAIAMYRRIGMPKHIEIAEALLAKARGT